MFRPCRQSRGKQSAVPQVLRNPSLSNPFNKRNSRSSRLRYVTFASNTSTPHTKHHHHLAGGIKPTTSPGGTSQRKDRNDLCASGEPRVPLPPGPATGPLSRMRPPPRMLFVCAQKAQMYIDGIVCSVRPIQFPCRNISQDSLCGSVSQYDAGLWVRGKNLPLDHVPVAAMNVGSVACAPDASGPRVCRWGG